MKTKKTLLLLPIKNKRVTAVIQGNSKQEKNQLGYVFLYKSQGNPLDKYFDYCIAFNWEEDGKQRYHNLGRYKDLTFLTVDKELEKITSELESKALKINLN